MKIAFRKLIIQTMNNFMLSLFINNTGQQKKFGEIFEML